MFIPCWSNSTLCFLIFLEVFARNVSEAFYYISDVSETPVQYFKKTFWIRAICDAIWIKAAPGLAFWCHIADKSFPILLCSPLPGLDSCFSTNEIEEKIKETELPLGCFFVAAFSERRLRIKLFGLIRE